MRPRSLRFRLGGAVLGMGTLSATRLHVCMAMAKAKRLHGYTAVDKG